MGMTVAPKCRICGERDERRIGGTSEGVLCRSCVAGFEHICYFDGPRGHVHRVPVGLRPACGWDGVVVPTG